jgi:alpha-glutamyl/putrescinyl thymine pyrophosphorylase clade 1
VQTQKLRMFYGICRQRRAHLNGSVVDPMDTTQLLRFIAEREAIRQRREAGQSPPLTADPILAEWSFTNVRREDDRVTRWIAANWREPHADNPDLFFAMTVARFINWPDTLAEIGFPIPWKPDHFLAVMAARVARALGISTETLSDWCARGSFPKGFTTTDNGPRRWKDDPDGTATDAATLDPSFDEADEADQPQKAPAPKHRFESMVAMIAQRDNVPLRVAATRARREFPTLYDDYQASVGVKKTYEQLIGDEIRKGCSDRVARQRIAALYPAAARESRESIAKSESGGVAEFMARVSEIMERDGVSRLTAMGRARKVHPDEFAKYQNV